MTPADKPAFPGVYVEEIPIGARAIEGVATSVTAFVGGAPSGPLDEPVRVTSFTAFVREFGAPCAEATLAHAVSQFFENGGGEALIVRVGQGGGAAIDDDSISAPKLETERRGLWALDKAEVFNLLCIPPLAHGPGGDIGAHTRRVATDYCRKRRALFLVDPLTAWRSPSDVTCPDGLGSAAFGLTRTPNAALYFPMIRATDPARDGRIESFAPSGAVAGVIARTDRTHGIWKAPAGIEATLHGLAGFALDLTDADNGPLNTHGVNCLRTLPQGRVVWGARTLIGDDASASEWKYVNVRRLVLYLEESIERGTQWAVFEPNDAPLWTQIRSTVENFLNDLWRQGAFQGTKPNEAYFVRCDRATMTQSDLDNGTLIIEVGVAPVRPAEFVILRIGQTVQPAALPPPPAGIARIEAWLRLGHGPRRRRRPGFRALFHGPSRTGMAMAAARLAQAAGRALYRVDLSAVMSKYIGETEKNLAAVFDRAQTERAILLFDEADALFGKRTDVKDAHDRYANLEVSYLLQRIEDFDGLVILTTNLRANFDAAFLRRLDASVRFPRPRARRRR